MQYHLPYNYYLAASWSIKCYSAPDLDIDAALQASFAFIGNAGCFISRNFAIRSQFSIHQLFSPSQHSSRTLTAISAVRALSSFTVIQDILAPAQQHDFPIFSLLSQSSSMPFQRRLYWKCLLAGIGSRLTFATTATSLYSTLYSILGTSVPLM